MLLNQVRYLKFNGISHFMKMLVKMINSIRLSKLMNGLPKWYSGKELAGDMGSIPESGRSPGVGNVLQIGFLFSTFH